MKTTIPALKPGDRLIADVVEVVSPEICILSVHGDLVRVQNNSQQVLKPNMTVYVRVATVAPLQFQLITNKSHEINIYS